MVRKILSVILIVIGSILILANLLVAVNPKGPESSETAFLVGYYGATVFMILFGALLIIFGVRIRRKLKRKKTEEELLDSLPT